MAIMVRDESAWLSKAEEQLGKLIDEMLRTEKTHMAAAEGLQNIHRRVGLLSAALSASAGATICR